MRGRPPVNEAASPHQTRNPRAPRSWTSGLANAPGRLAVSLPRSLGCGPASAAAAGLTVTPTPRPWTPSVQPDLSRLFLGACMRVHRTGSEKQQIDNRNDPVLTLILQMGIKAHETSVTCPVSFFLLVTGEPWPAWSPPRIHAGSLSSAGPPALSWPQGQDMEPAAGPLASLCLV